MKKLFALVTVPLLLAACQSGPSQFVLNMQSLQGATEAQVIDRLGPPDNVYEVEGTKYLTYTKITQNYYTGNPAYGFGSYGYPRGSGVWINQGFGSGSVQAYRCDAILSLVKKRVTRVGFRGSAC